MMSRAVAPLVELAAAAARETSPDVLFGAYACGGYGETRAEGARDRFAWFKDPLCHSFEPGFKESPRVAAAVGAGTGVAYRLPQFYGSCFPRRLPQKLLTFGARAQLARIAAATVSRAGDADDVAAFHALGGVRVVLYLDAELEDSEEDAGKKAAAAVAESALTSRVMRLLAAGARVLVARCHRSAAEDADDDSKDEDADDGPADSCGGAGVTYAPQLRVYGVNASAAEGRAVVDEPLVEARDAAIAVGAVEATLSALLGPSDAIVGAAADETAERPDEPDADDASAGSCGNPPPAPAADGYLDVPPAERLEAPPATPEPPPPPPRREELPPRAQKRRANSRLYASAGGGGGFIGGR
mmetsp:Transcript_9303/g.28974  ORF Transcript_9303/g.28974 Transcript_9303/m.28974 type:complete len:357 (-) Transcript_9303:30-1100(-)